MAFRDVIVLHVRDVPHPDGVGQEYEVLYPPEFSYNHDIPSKYETVEEWLQEELRNPKKWRCLVSVEDGGLNYIEVYQKIKQ